MKSLYIVVFSVTLSVIPACYMGITFLQYTWITVYNNVCRCVDKRNNMHEVTEKECCESVYHTPIKILIEFGELTRMSEWLPNILNEEFKRIHEGECNTCNTWNLTEENKEVKMSAGTLAGYNITTHSYKKTRGQAFSHITTYCQLIYHEKELFLETIFREMESFKNKTYLRQDISCPILYHKGLSLLPRDHQIPMLINLIGQVEREYLIPHTSKHINDLWFQLAGMNNQSQNAFSLTLAGNILFDSNITLNDSCVVEVLDQFNMMTGYNVDFHWNFTEQCQISHKAKQRCVLLSKSKEKIQTWQEIYTFVSLFSNAINSFHVFLLTLHFMYRDEKEKIIEKSDRTNEQVLQLATDLVTVILAFCIVIMFQYFPKSCVTCRVKYNLFETEIILKSNTRKFDYLLETQPKREIFTQNQYNADKACLLLSKRKHLFTFHPSTHHFNVYDTFPVHRNGIDFNPMTKEWFRLGTFNKNAKLLPMSPHELAAVGFYCTGNSKETQCFACNLKYSDWKEGDNPRLIHYRLSPQCPFLLGNISDSNSHTFGTADHRSTTEIRANGCEQSLRDSTLPVNGDNTHVNGAIKRNEIPFPNNGYPPSNGLSFLVSCDGNSYITQNDSLRDDTTRRGPSLNDALLVKNGDHLRDTHQRYLPNRYNGQNTSSSALPLHGSPNGKSNFPKLQTKVDSKHAYRKSRVQSVSTHFDGCGNTTPRYPAFEALTVRISTYQGWPSYLTQTPRDMANAGFLYAGYGDYVKCYFCGGGLQYWDTDDDPMIEHAFWFPKCLFVRSVKGDEFIEFVRAIRSNQGTEQNSWQTEGPDTAGATSNMSALALPETEYMSQEQAAAGVTDLDKDVKAVVDMGFTTTRVQDAIQTLLSEQRTANAANILETLLGENDGSRIPYNHSTATTNGNEALSAPLVHTGVENGATGADIVPTSNAESVSNSVSYTASACSVNSSTLPDVMSQEETKSLMDENRQLKDQRVCKICMEGEANIAFLPCGHLVCCSSCAPALRKCPICRKIVQGTIKTWLA